MENGSIKKIFTQDEMLRLSNIEREKMGLRILDLKNVELRKIDNKILNNCLEIKKLNVGYKKKKVAENITL